MENKDNIPYYAYDALIMMYNKSIRRMWILCIILIALLFGSNIGWLIYESQFEVTSTKIEQEADWEEDSNVIFNGTGVVRYGEGETDNNH